MNIYKIIRSHIHLYYSETPIEVKKFIRNALVVFFAWKAVYYYVLIDERLLDRPLTQNVGEGTSWFLNNCTSFSGFKAISIVRNDFFEGVFTLNEVSQLQHWGKNVLFIADGCNGLELMVLYLGFIICFSASLLKKIIFMILGLVVIYCANILRCAGLAFLKVEYNDYFDFSHHYTFKITLYGIIFLLWMLFTKQYKIKNETI